MKINLYRGTALDVPDRKLRAKQHVRILLATQVRKQVPSTGAYSLRILDWELDPPCRHCGANL